MQTHTYPGGSITLYDSSKSMPIARYHAMNKFAIQESGIGNTIQDVMGHFGRLAEHLQRKDVEKAALELENLHYNFFLALNSISITGRTFLCYVHSINGQILQDVEDDHQAGAALKSLEQMGLTAGDIDILLDEVKKKLMPN